MVGRNLRKRDYISEDTMECSVELGSSDHNNGKRIRLYGSPDQDSGSDCMPMEHSVEEDEPYIDVVSEDSAIHDEEMAEDEYIGNEPSHYDTITHISNMDNLLSSHEDSAIIKSEIFDPAYDAMNLLVSYSGDYDHTFLNGVDNCVSSLYDIKNDSELKLPANILNSPVLSSQGESKDDSDSSQETSGHTDDEYSDHSPTSSPEAPISVQTNPTPGLISTVATPVVNINNLNAGNLLGSDQHVFTTPVFLAQGTTGPSGQTNSIITTHLARLVPSADGKGYILHLGLSPSNTGTNSVLSTIGKLNAGNNNNKEYNGSTSEQNTGSEDKLDNTEAGKNELTGLVNGPLLSPNSRNVNNDAITTEGLSLSNENKFNGDIVTCENATFCVGPQIDANSLPLIENGGSQVIDAQLQKIFQPTRPKSKRRNSKELRELMELEQISSKQGGDPDRFVICSDGPMNCALCGYNTTNYSSFKSHIICSHPCWRITKKLSRNRLLVEKSVKVSVPVANFSVPNPVPAVPIQQRVATKKNKKESSNKEKSHESKHSKKDAENKSVKNSVKQECQLFRDSDGKITMEGKRHIYKCSKCHRIFVTEKETVTHITETHQNKKPYSLVEVSNDYGKSFTPVYVCMVKGCNHRSDSIGALERHKAQAHTQQVVYRCQICGFSAESTKAVKEHAIKIHRQQVMMYGLTD